MKAAELDLLPAPKRGQYDRALSRRERQDAQRDRVMLALAALSEEGRELSIASVVELAGIGRNTFYEYFDDVEHALAAVRARSLAELTARVERELSAARTPLERVRALARAWVDHLFESSSLVKLALRAQAPSSDATQLSVLAQHVARVLNSEVAARSALPALADPVRVATVAAVFETLARAHGNVRAFTNEDLQRTLSDLALRLLR